MRLLAATLLLALWRGHAAAAAATSPAGPLSSQATGPRPPPPPARVHFLAHTFRHLLLWAPGGGSASPGGLLYDVQFKR